MLGDFHTVIEAAELEASSEKIYSEVDKFVSYSETQE